MGSDPAWQREPSLRHEASDPIFPEFGLRPSILLQAFADKSQRMRSVAVDEIEVITAEREEKTKERREERKEHPSPAVLGKRQGSDEPASELPEITPPDESVLRGIPIPPAGNGCRWR